MAMTTSGMVWAVRLCAVAAVSVASVSAHATLSCPSPDGNGPSLGECIAGQGTWQTSLQGRSSRNDGIFDAYYDTVLDLTWLADANAGAGSTFDDVSSLTDGLMSFSAANAWAASLTLFGGTGWRLPTLTPVNGSTFNTAFSNNGSTDEGTAKTGEGWRNDSNISTSELGYMYYVHLGNKGSCTPNDANPDSCSPQDNSNLSNTGPFANLLPTPYWTDTVSGSDDAWEFNFRRGIQFSQAPQSRAFRAWAVHSGDLIGPPAAPVPEPGTLLLVAPALVALGAPARRR